MRTKQIYILIALVFVGLIVQAILASPVSAAYVSSGTVTSANLLSDSSASSITNFYYNISSLPGDSSVTIQFSTTTTAWYSSAGVLDGSDTLSTTDGADLSLTTLASSGTAFYYKMTINSTSDLTDTPVVADIRLDYTLTSGYNDMFVIDDDGNVGIGSIGTGNAAGSKLSVQGGGTFGSSYFTNTAPTNGILVQGNVGIGTTSPYAKLSVWADSTSDTLLELVDTASTTVFSIDTSGNLTTLGNATTTGSHYIGGTASSTTALNTQGDSHIGGNLSVDGTTTLLGDITQTGNLDITGYASTTTYLNTQGDLHAGGNASIDGNATTTGSLNVDGDFLTDGTGSFANAALTIDSNGNLTTTGYASSTTGLFTQGNLHAGGNLTIDGSSTTTTGSMYIGNDLTVMSGNVGIGTTSPQSLLTLYSSTGDSLISFGDSNSNTAHWYIGTDYSHDSDFKISTSSSNLGIAEFTIDRSTGYVGIGTTTPQTALHIGTASSTNLTSYGDSVMISGELEVGETAYLGPLEFDTNAGIISWIDMPVTSGASAGTVESYTARIDGTSILTLYAESDGSGGIRNPRVGINTTTPWASLSVTGVVGSSTPLFSVATTTNDGSTSYFNIDVDGNVGIGTTTPDSLLTVDGTFAVGTNGTEFIVDADGRATTTDRIHIGGANSTSTIAGNLDVAGNIEAAVWYIGDIIFNNNFRMTEATTTELLDVLSINNASNIPLLYLVENGYVGIATTTPTNILTIGQGRGSAIADGWDVYSSEEYKTDITYLEEQDYEDILDEIGGLDIATYRWKEEDEELGTMLGVIAEQAPERVLSDDGNSISLYDYATFALAGVKALQGEIEKMKLDIQGNLTFVDENGEDFQLALDDDGYVVIDKLKVKDLEIVEGGQMTLPDGENQITGTGIVPIDSDFAVIENNRIASTSKIFITFNSDLKGKSWWVCEKRDAELFRLCLSGTTNKELNFDYWIVQTMLTGTTTLEVISTTTEPVIEEPVVVEEEEEAPVVEEEEPVVEEEIVEDPVVEEEVAEEPVVEEEVAEEEPIIEEEEEPVVEAPILSPTESEEENRESAISEPNQDDLEEIGKEPVVEEEGI